MIAFALVTSTVHAAPGDRWDGGTVGIQLGGAAAGGLGGGALLGIGGLLIGGKVAHQGDWGTPLVGAVLGMVAGLTIGAPLGAQIAGDREHGTGRRWGTALGEVGALGIASALVYALVDRPRSGLPLTIAAVALVLTGPVIGYQLTSDARATTQARTALIVPLTAAVF